MGTETDFKTQSDPSSSVQEKTIVVVDSETLVRSAIKSIIDSLNGFKVVGEAGDAVTAMEQLEKTQPDMVLIEVALKGCSGIDLIYEIQRRKLDTIPVMLSRVDAPHLVSQAISAGAKGYILKSDGVREFQEGLTTISRFGRLHLSPKLVDQSPTLVNLPAVDEDASQDPLAKMTRREREVFHLLASGLSNKAIAKKLFISPRTVETHRARIVRKLGLRTNGELIRFAIRHGLSVV